MTTVATVPAGAHPMSTREAAAPAGSGAAQSLQLPVTLQPHRNLLRYYLLTSLMFGPAVLFAAVPMYFRYRTLRYDVDSEGITMRWGILFRREVSLTYARIQDIQLTSNVVERWLGLARIQLQTASGSSTAEMTIEGILDVAAMRDFLYTRMRGTADTPAAITSPDVYDTSRVAAADQAATLLHDDAADVAQLTAALDAVAAELRALRGSIAAGGRTGGRDE